LIQLAALALAAFRVPLAAQYPQPAEFQAVRVMLAAQFSALAILFPWLIRTWASAVAVIASAWAMLIAAAALSAWESREVLLIGTFLSCWIAVFAIISRLRLRPMLVIAIVSAYVIGGPLLWYVQLDLGFSTHLDSTMAFGPLLAALSTPRHLPPSIWIQTAVTLAISLAAWTIISFRRKNGSRSGADGF
jgi:hypothetical protein